MDLRLSGKTAIVTGGSRGIGKAIARQLAREGVDVALVARDQQTLDAAAEELQRETGRKIIGISADTGDAASVRSMVTRAADAMGHLDILVNGAAKPGGGPAPKLTDITDDMVPEELNVKVLGYLRCAREVAPFMVKQGWGRIINISGLAARAPTGTIGSMRNIAVVAMTKNLADELGPQGINVTVIHPGMTLTETVEARLAGQANKQGVSLDDVKRKAAENNSVRHIITPEEVANVVTFLASPLSVAINGEVISVGGGAGRAIFY